MNITEWVNILVDTKFKLTMIKNFRLPEKLSDLK